MTKLDQFREKYPQYNDMSDMDLIDKIHDKYYSDLTKEDLYKRLEFSPSGSEQSRINQSEFDQYRVKETPGFAGIGQDILSGAKAAPSALYEGLKSLPGELYGAGKQAFTDPSRAARNVLAGTAEYGHNILNFPSTVAEYLSQKEFISPESAQRVPRQEDYDYAEMVGLEGSEPGDVFLRQLATISGLGPAGELGELGALGRTAARSGSLGAQSAIQGENPVTAALGVPLAEGAVRGAGSAARRAAQVDLSPSGIVAKRFGGRLTPEELEKNIRATEGTETSLGNVIGSPYLRKLHENILPNIAFGPGEKGIRRAAIQTEERAGSLLDRLRGELDPSADPNLVLREVLDNAYETQRNIKNDLYAPVNQLEATENFKLSLPGFRERASKISDSLEGSALRADPDLRSLFAKANTVKDSNTPLSIVEAKVLRDSISSEAKNLSSSSMAAERTKGRQLSKLAKLLGDDIKEEINKKGSVELKEALEKADKNYKENYSQWLDELKLLDEGKSSEKLIDEIKKSGKNLDRYERIEKIQKLLPQDQQNLLGYGLLNKAVDVEGNLRAASLAKEINKLGSRQLKALFPNEEIFNQVLDFKRLARLNEYPLRAQQNPPTGHTLKEVSGAATLGTAAGLGGVRAIGGLAGASRAASSILESPKFRERVTDKLIKKREERVLTEAEKARRAKQKKLSQSLSRAFPYAKQVTEENE